MSGTGKTIKNRLLERLQSLQLRPNEKFIVAVLGIAIGIFKTKEDVEAVIKYLDSQEMSIFPCREWDSGEIFTSYVEAKSPDTTIH